MTIEEQVLDKLRALPPERQREVLDFVTRLKGERGKASRRGLAGLWASLHLSVTEEDIDQVRREMWGAFPREIS